MKAELDGDVIVLTDLPEEKNEELPGLSFDVVRGFLLPLSWASCVTLRNVMGDDLDIGPNLLKWAQDEKVRVASAMVSKEVTDGEVELDVHEPEYDDGTDDIKPKDVENTWWYELWQGMPEFLNYDVSPWKTVKVHFRNRADLEEFQKRMGFKVTKFPVGTGVVWYPPAEERGNEWRYVDE